MVNCGFDGVNHCIVSALAEFPGPVVINVLMVLRRNLERDRVGSRIEQESHQLFMSVPGRDPQGRPQTGFGVEKTRVVIRAVQDIRMTLQEIPYEFDLPSLADLFEFLDFSEAGIRLWNGSCHK